MSNSVKDIVFGVIIIASAMVAMMLSENHHAAREKILRDSCRVITAQRDSLATVLDTTVIQWRSTIQGYKECVDLNYKYEALLQKCIAAHKAIGKQMDEAIERQRLNEIMRLLIR